MNKYVEKYGPLKGLYRGTEIKLWNAGFDTRKKVRDGVLSQKIFPGKYPRNYGEKTHREVCQWLGIEVPEKLPRNTCVCPKCKFVFTKP